jgi:putative restriction endonuclease
MNYTDLELDRAVRLAAFEFLAGQIARFGEVIPARVLSRDFVFRGSSVPLIGPQGIFKPKILPEMPISIKTAPEVPGKPRPYDDRPIESGVMIYRYRGIDPFHHENVRLRLAMTRGVPLIYCYGVEEGYYRPIWPVFVVDDHPASLSFFIMADEVSVSLKVPEWNPDIRPTPRRRYITVEVQQRLHQVAFRAHVLRAYKNSCAVCRLRHPELLEAAHILEDRHPRGVPAISNGLSMCSIHHKAFDSNILGVRPDYSVEIREDVLHEIDGPMLRYGLQEFQDHGILVPRRPDERPDRDALKERFERFRAAG